MFLTVKCVLAALINEPRNAQLNIHRNTRSAVEFVCALLRSRLSLSRNAATDCETRRGMRCPSREPTMTQGNHDSISGGHTTSSPALVDSVEPVPRSTAPPRAPAPHAIVIRMASHRAASVDIPELLPLVPRGKPFNSKQPYSRVHRHGQKNPYDRSEGTCLQSEVRMQRPSAGHRSRQRSFGMLLISLTCNDLLRISLANRISLSTICDV